MKILDLIQGTPEWHAHRAKCFNASDAPAMMGVSPYEARSALIARLATGIVPEVDAATQRRFDEGHRTEALARSLAEKIIGDELYPVTGVSDCGKYSASFDGLTMDGLTAFEHKTLNESLRYDWDEGNGWHLPEHYQIQMEHQLLVSGAERVLFMASKWDGETLVEERHCWYYPDADLRARIIAGWEQLAADVSAYKAEPATATVVAATVEGFGALSLRVEGRVLASNLDAFRAGAEAFIARLPKPQELQTDQDFADADAAVKVCADAEARIKVAKEEVVAQMGDIDAALRTVDAIAETIRTARLALDKAVKSEKEARKLALVKAGVDSVMAHYKQLADSMGEYAPNIPASLTSEIGASIKGLKSLSSMRDKIDAAVASAKIDASQKAEKIRACVAALEDHKDHAQLFPDRVALAHSKEPEDLRNLVAARIAENEKQQQEKLEAERERIRAEEQARAERDAQDKLSPHDPATVNPSFLPGNNAALAQPVEHLPSKQNVAGSIPAGRSRPSDDEIIRAIALHFSVSNETARGWLTEIAKSA